MKKIRLLSFFVLLCITSLGQDSTSAYKYILDYLVPTSPGFMILDVAPQQVTRGSASKPMVANLFSNYLETKRFDPGIALDFSPYILLGGGFKNIKDYQDNDGKRILANTLFSAASIQNNMNPNNTDVGLGLRITLIDSRDLFSENNNEITDKIGNALANAAIAPVIIGVPSDVTGIENNTTGTIPVDLSRIYDEAYRLLKAKKGSALSVGFGYRSTLNSSVADLDSLFNKQYMSWATFSMYNIFPGADLLSLVQGRFGEGMRPEWKGGIALTSQNKYSNIIAELVYNTITKELEYGANFEIKLLRKLSYVVSLGKRSIQVGNEAKVEKFRVISNFRLNIFSQ